MSHNRDGGSDVPPEGGCPTSDGGSDPPQIWACPELPIGLLSGSFEIFGFDPTMWGVREGGMMSHIRGGGSDPPHI